MAVKYDTLLPLIRVESTMKKGLEELAAKDNRTLSDFVRLHLSKLLENNNLQPKKLKK